MKSIIDFHRPIAVRSASPRPDREPAKRGMPPTPAPAPVEPERNERPRTPEEIETWRKSEQLGIDVAGVISSKCLIGKAPTGQRLDVGSNNWNWLRVIGYHTVNGVKVAVRQDPPVHVPGAVYADHEDARRQIKHTTEAAAMRADRDAFLASIGAGEVSRSLMRRFERKVGR